MYENVFVTENGEKQGILYPYALLISKKELTHRRTFWDFTSPEFQALIQGTKEVPRTLLVTSSLTLSLHREMSLQATLDRHPEYSYNNGVLYRRLGETQCPVACVTKDSTFSHIFSQDEYLVRSKTYLEGLEVPVREIPFEYAMYRERIIKLFVTRNMGDLIDKVSGTVDDGFHPCYQITSTIGTFIYYGICPPVIEFKDPSITLILPPTFDISVKNASDYMISIPNPKTLTRLLRGYIVGPMLLEFFNR